MRPDEFHAWLISHARRHVMTRLPDPTDAANDAVYEHWRRVFAKIGVDVTVATDASERLLDNPPRASRDHWPALLAHAREILRARGSGGVDDTRETATVASRDCQRCRGEGLTIVFAKPGATGPRTVSATCDCRLGEWIRRTNAKKNDPTIMIPPLSAVRAGGTAWTADPPDRDLEFEAACAHFSAAELIRDWISRPGG